MQLKVTDKKLSQELANIFTEQAFINGLISSVDLSDKEVLVEKLIEIARQFDESRIIIDHRDTLLSEAEIKLHAKQYELSTMFYALYFEHMINAIIDLAMTKKSISKKYKTEILRRTDNQGKYSWLLVLLGLPEFNDKHRKLILNVVDERNAFAHYKWNTTFDEEKEKKLFELLVACKKSVKYIKSYESRIGFSGQKNKLKKVLTNKSTRRKKTARVI